MFDSVDELRRNRYLVLANYPNSPYKIGDVFSVDDKGYFVLCCYGHSDHEEYHTESIHQDEITKYPALFSQVPWFYGRIVDEFPTYLQYTGPDEGKKGKVCRVYGWEIRGAQDVYFRYSAELLYWRHAGDFMPIGNYTYNQMQKFFNDK